MFWKSPSVIQPESMSEEQSELLTDLGMDLTPNGIRLLGCGSHISLSATSSASSPGGVVTRGTLNLALPELCELLTQHRSLQGAEITSTEAYREGRGHLLLLLKLYHNGRTLYLRLEQTSSAAEDAASNYTAQLSSLKEILVRRCTTHNQQTFSGTPTLGELRHLLRSVCDNVTVHAVHMPFDWFFVFLLQNYLQESGNGEFVGGEMKLPKPADLNRNQIREALRLHRRIPTTFSLTELLHSLRRCPESYPKLMQPSLSNAVELATYQDASADYDTVRGRRLAYKLATQIQSFTEQLDASAHGAEIRHLWEESVEILRVLYGRKPRKYQALYSRTLYCLGTHLHRAEYWEKAERSLREASRLCRQSYDADASEHNCKLLASVLHEYAATLGKLGRDEDARRTTLEVLGLCRKLFESRYDPNAEPPAFVRGFGDFLFLGEGLAFNLN